MSVKVRLKMKSCNLICEILLKQDFYLFQFKIANLFRNYLIYVFHVVCYHHGYLKRQSIVKYPDI